MMECNDSPRALLSRSGHCVSSLPDNDDGCDRWTARSLAAARLCGRDDGATSFSIIFLICCHCCHSHQNPQFFRSAWVTASLATLTAPSLVSALDATTTTLSKD